MRGLLTGRASVVAVATVLLASCSSDGVVQVDETESVWGAAADDGAAPQVVLDVRSLGRGLCSTLLRAEGPLE